MKSFLLRLSLFLGLAAVIHAEGMDLPKRMIPKEAYAYELKPNWELTGALPENAMIITLEGLANRGEPRFYLEYPADWHFKDVRPLKGYYERRYGIHFRELKNAEEALNTLGKYAKGYVVWDKEVRTSLNVAFTAAGLLDAVVVNADLIPLVEKHGLKKLEDFRGKFTGQTDVQIYQWAFDRYWKDCNHDYVIWMGGVAGTVMEPGVADIAVNLKAFVTDLSANPKHVEELALHKKLLAAMNPGATIIGWHSYAKDSEALHVTLTSSFGYKVEGLNTLPNVSFTRQIPFTPDFKPANNHHVAADAKLKPEAKVYVCLVQTDSMGIGAWNEPERGEIPYTWQIPIGWMKYNPAALQFFYEQKKPADYFIGGLSGPGYMYPAVIPPARFGPLMQEALDLMKLLDLRVFEIMDHTRRMSEKIPHGYFDLNKATVDLYYKTMPDMIGFVNGYASAHTYDLREGRAFMSYDYYVDENRAKEDVISDLNELMTVNDRRPYFMLVHVRESNTIKRMMEITAGLAEKVELVPLDTFLKLSAGEKTYETRFADSPKTR